jgi:HSP20 family protein
MRTLLPAFRTNRLINLPELNFFDSVLDDFAVPNLYSKDAQWLPKIDISENENEFLVRVEVPGIDKKDIDITLSEGLLTIKGEKKFENEEKNENFHRRESRYGSFTRSFQLSSEIENDGIEANYRDGVLKITLPKAEAVAPKKIEVKS